CPELTFLQKLAVRIRALLSADTDQALVRARTDGEKLIGLLRLGFILIFSYVAFRGLSNRESWPFELLLIGTSLRYGGGVLLLAVRVSSAWVPWFTSTIDVTLVTAALVTFVAAGDPLGALNNRSYFDTYFFVVITSTLRYDWRIAAFAASLAFLQFMGLTA